jgi:23S rRNA pseudouridine1911/1915/1917 synthase
VNFLEATVPSETDGIRADLFVLAQLEDSSRSEVQRWFSQGVVRVDGEPVPKSRALKAGQLVTIAEAPAKPDTRLIPEEIPLNIVYEDDDLVVIHKPKGLVVHPGNGIVHGTLASGLLHRFRTLSTLNGEARPGLVHRLDKDTSGLLVVARHDVAHRALAAQLVDRTLRRTYRALVWRHPPASEGTVETGIARDPVQRLRMVVNPAGRHSITHYRVTEWWDSLALLEVNLETGRTHQIRVHMNYLGCPVAGDPLYQGREEAMERLGPLVRMAHRPLLGLLTSQALQACALAFNHPRTGDPLRFELPEDPEMAAALAYLRSHFRSSTGDLSIPPNP